jgi:glycosyltransferase involved in cell wall biosynthesis
MKILVLSQYYWPEAFRINELVVSLRKTGCEVAVLTGQPNYPEGIISTGYSALSVKTQFHDGITIYRVPLVPRGKGSAVRLVANYLSFVFSAAIFGTWMLRKRDFDVILVYAPSPILQVLPAMWLKLIKGCSLVTWVQDLWPESLQATGFVQNLKMLQVIGSVVRWIYRNNDLLLVQSRAFVDRVLPMAGSTPVIYYPNSGELVSGEASTTMKSTLRLDPGFNIVFAGNLGTVQALDTVLDAALLLKNETDIRFVLIGSGSRSEMIKERVIACKLKNVMLPGRFPSGEMPAIFNQASALLVSLSRNFALSQTVPSKVQAYLAAGRPIIASLDGEGARVVLESGAGLVCPAENAQALADAVIKLRDAPVSVREDMGAAGVSYYSKNFEPNMLTRRLIEILMSLRIKAGGSDAVL